MFLTVASHLSRAMYPVRLTGASARSWVMCPVRLTAGSPRTGAMCPTDRSRPAGIPFRPPSGRMSLTRLRTPDAPLSVAAFVIYVTLSLTDKVDGYLARSRDQITDFGKFLDPIADKLLVFSALLLLLERGEVGVWVVFVILVREFLVSALRMVASANGEVIAADKLGKAKTAVTMVALCGFYLAYALLSLGLDLGYAVGLVAWALMVAAVVTSSSGDSHGGALDLLGRPRSL